MSMSTDSSRFTVIYRVFAETAGDAADRARDIALEQTVEVPDDVVPDGFIRDEIVGQIEKIDPAEKGVFSIHISYSTLSGGGDLTQILNVIMGNTSIQKGVKVTGFSPAKLLDDFPGPRFGIDGIRKLCGRSRGGLIVPVIKPQGSSAKQLAEISHNCAAAGADIIKEDHGLADQSMAPFRERVARIAEAVAKANARTGGKSLYFANIVGPPGQLTEMAAYAKEAGADGLLLMPGLLGFGVVDSFRKNPDLAMPIMTHPSFLGPYVLSHDTGFSHAMMFGILQRLAGADISVFPNVGGRFGFTADECISIADACRDREGIGLAILPSPGGGMTPERMGDMRGMYGEDVAYLLGGSLLRHADRIGDVIGGIRAGLDSAE